MRVQSEKTQNIPELKSSAFSRLTLHWIGYYLGLGSKIEEKSLPEILQSREAENLWEELDKNWQIELKKKSPSVTIAVWATQKWNLLSVALISLIAATINFFSMSFIGVLIDWFGDNSSIGRVLNQVAQTKVYS